LTADGTTAVDKVKAVLLEKDEVLVTANIELQKVHATLAEAQTMMAQKKTALVAA
jgi:hypothetical protein